MNKKRTKLTQKQTEVLALLGAGLSIEAASEGTGVQNHLINLWMKTDLFREELRLVSERARATFEARVFTLANNSASVVGDMIKDVKDKNRQLEGVKLAFGSAVRLANRYKELQVEGYVAPAQPLVVFPMGTRFPWQNKIMLPAQPLEIPAVVDVEAQEVQDNDEGTEGPE